LSLLRAGRPVAALAVAASRVPPAGESRMAPHGRLLLEHVAEAAGGSAALPVSSVGVFVGCMWAAEYVDEVLPSLGASPAAPAAITGNTFPFIAGRVAYVFGWRGPCVPTDTACSSGRFNRPL